MRAIFQNRAEYHLKIFFLENFCPVIVCLLRIWTYENADEKEHTFLLLKKTNKNGRKKVTM